MKILVVGDSYGLPRFHKKDMKVELSYEETYPECLRQILVNNYHKDVLLVNRCRHANTTYSLVQGEASEIMFLRPEYVVVQLGLADLWPRQLRNVKPIQNELESKDPWVNEEEFQFYMVRFISCALKNSSKVIVVNIPKVADHFLRQHPLIASRTVKYNALLKKICGTMQDVLMVDLYGIIEQNNSKNKIGSDGVHPTFDASLELAKHIFEKIKILSKIQ
ncbi:MAG: SGNH/GDSL hydrolase family protein [Acidaminococcaceae bacterium]